MGNNNSTPINTNSKEYQDFLRNNYENSKKENEKIEEESKMKKIYINDKNRRLNNTKPSKIVKTTKNKNLIQIETKKKFKKPNMYSNKDLIQIEREKFNNHKKIKNKKSKKKQINQISENTILDKFELQDLEKLGYNPYEIFEINIDFDIIEVRNKFKNMARKYHPDRGGNAYFFNICKKSYIYLVDKYKSKKQKKDYFQLKTTFENNKEKPMKNKKMANGRFNLNQFNEIYDDNQLEKINDHGYGSEMIESSNIREDINIKNEIKKYTKTHFNETFQNKKKKYKTHIVKIEEPKPIQISKKLKYSELGEKKINNFSSKVCQNNQNGLSFTDYKHAHSSNNLINVGDIKRKQYKNIKDIQYKRKNQNFKLTKKQQQKLLKLDEQKQLQEQERIIRIKNRDKNISKHFHKTNHLMINFRN